MESTATTGPWRTPRALRALALLAGFGLASPASAHTTALLEDPGDGTVEPTTAGMIVVTTDADELNADGDCSLREAVEAANTDTAVDACAAGTPDGDTITFASAYTISLSLGELLLSDDVSIDASGVGTVVVDAGGTSRIFDVDAVGGTGSEQAVAFTSLTLTGGDSGEGGSSAPDAGGAVDLKAGSDATFTDVNVSNSVAGVNGGGIHGAGSTTILITTTASGTSTISGNEAQGNDAGMGGGGVWGAGSTTISGNVTISGNSATGTSGSGGGVFNFGGVLDITGATISNNTANRAGGGVEDFGDADDDTDVTLTDVTLTGNSIVTPAPGNGGGLHSGGGEVVVVGGLVQNNTAVEGGGLWGSGTLAVSGGTLIDGNVATSDDDAPFEGGGGIFNQAGTITVDGATISNNTALGTGGAGAPGSGGGAFNNGGTLSISNSTLSGNQSMRAGGGIEVNGGTVRLTDTDFTENTSGGAPGNGGALHVTMGTVNATGGAVVGNTAAREGGGFWNNAGWTMTVDGTSFSGNTASGPAADDGGGALFNNGGTLVVMNATLDRNAATGTAGSGGGILNLGGVLNVTGGTIQNNAANRAGGGIEDAAGTVVLTEVVLNSNFIDVAAPGNGGGLHSGGGDVTVVGGEVTRNVAVEGGGLWTNKTLSLQPAADGTPSLVSLNMATGDDATQGGGGLYAESGAVVTGTRATIGWNEATGTAGSGGGVFVADSASVALTLGTVTWNKANRAGAGIEVGDNAATAAASTISLDRVEVTWNAIADAEPGNGGGLHVGGAGSADVAQSTFANNGATEGAGIWISASGDLDLSNSTVSNNAATGAGGGVYVVAGGTANVMSATVASNTAGTNGGGLAIGVAATTQFSIQNTLVGDNLAGTAGPDCFGTFQSGDYNLVENTSGCTLLGATGNNVTGMNPALAALANNGGPTATRALMAGSPAIDAGMTAFAVDQRGFARNDGADDIGAVEFGAVAGNTVACTAMAPLLFSDYDADPTDGSADPRGEFAEVTNDAGDGTSVDLSGCDFVVFDPFTEMVTYAADAQDVLGDGHTHSFATVVLPEDGQTIPPMTLPDGPGAFALIDGSASVGQSIGTVLANADVVAAVVYLDDDNVFGSARGGSDAAANAEAMREAISQLHAVASEDDGAVDLQVAVAPNPISGAGSVAFGLAEAADVRVALYDALGREVAVLADGPFSAGRHAVRLAASAFPTGVYVVRIAVGSEAQQTARLTIVR